MNRIKVDTLLVVFVGIQTLMTLYYEGVNIPLLINRISDSYQHLDKLTQTKCYVHFFLTQACDGNCFGTKLVH